MNEDRLREELMGLGLSQFEYFEQIGSTNDAAKAWLAGRDQGIYAALADEQTQGRGRGERSWQSPPGSAIALSMGFSAGEIGPEIAPLLAGVASLACSRAAEGLWGLEMQIKWPNDLIIERQKVGGILIESEWQGQSERQTVMGIGINVAAASVAGGQDFRFAASYLEAFSGAEIGREQLVRAVTQEALALIRESDKEQIVAEWNARLAFSGEEIEFLREGEEALAATIAGVDAQGRLLLERTNGEQKAYSAGEIRLLAR